MKIMHLFSVFLQDFRKYRLIGRDGAKCGLTATKPASETGGGRDYGGTVSESNDQRSSRDPDRRG